MIKIVKQLHSTDFIMTSPDENEEQNKIIGICTVYDSIMGLSNIYDVIPYNNPKLLKLTAHIGNLYVDNKYRSQH